MADVKTVHVTPAQKQAAKALVNRRAEGRAVGFLVRPDDRQCQIDGPEPQSQPSSNGSTALHAP